jgi:hypothetical protein
MGDSNNNKTLQFYMMSIITSLAWVNLNASSFLMRTNDIGNYIFVFLTFAGCIIGIGILWYFKWILKQYDTRAHTQIHTHAHIQSIQIQKLNVMKCDEMNI